MNKIFDTRDTFIAIDRIFAPFMLIPLPLLFYVRRSKSCKNKFQLKIKRHKKLCVSYFEPIEICLSDLTTMEFEIC